MKNTRHYIFTFAIVFVGLVAAKDFYPLMARLDEGATLYSDYPPREAWASYGNRVIYYSNSGNAVSIAEVDANGNFAKVVDVGSASTTTTKFGTNGNFWIRADESVGGVAAFQIDANNAVVNVTTIYASLADKNLIMDDNTIVVLSKPNLLTFDYLGNNTWIQNDQIIEATYVYDISIVGNTMVLFNGTFYFYERTAKTWILTDQYYSEYYVYTCKISYNGVDTVVMTSAVATNFEGSFIGLVEIVTKVEGQWQQQLYYPKDFETSYNPSFTSVTFIDQNTMILGTPNDNTVSGNKRSTTIGSAFLIQRQNNTWVPTAKFLGPNISYFGLGSMIMKDYFVLVGTIGLGGDGNFLTVPRCVLDPIYASCNDKQLDTCETNITTVNAFTTLSAGLECGEVTGSVTNVRFNSFNFTLEYKLDKPLVPSYHCNATLSCPVPVMPIAPVSSNIPINAPVRQVSDASFTSVICASFIFVVISLL